MPITKSGTLRRLLRMGAALVAATLLLAVIAAAQSQAINGSIRGHVADPSGAAVAGATVTVTNTSTGFTRTVTTGADGDYAAVDLPLGTYTVGVVKAGFSKVEHGGVVIEAGTEAVIDEALKVGEVSSVVEVTGGAPVVAPAQTDVGRTITTQEVVNLPLTSRNPYNFIIFQPGVSGHPNQEQGIPRTINTNGLGDRINYQMDGMVDTEAIEYGERLFPISDAFVSEVQTVSDSFAPEFGNTAGDIYNVITGSGTNDFHGLFQWIRRSQDLTAYPLLSTPGSAKPDLQESDYSANAGGHIIKNKLFFFGAYEHFLRGEPTPVTIDPDVAAALNIPAQDLAPAPGLEHVNFLDTRIDWAISPTEQAFIRYNYFRNAFPYNTGVGGLDALSVSEDYKDRAHQGAFQLISSLSPNLLNEFRSAWAIRANFHYPSALQGPGPEIAISGVANFNGGAANDHFREVIPSANDNLTWIHGPHTFKFGGSIEQINDLNQNASSDVYTFAKGIGTTPAELISNYTAALASPTAPCCYTSFTITGQPSPLTYSLLFYGFYGQDTWQVTPKLTVIYGLRWDQYRGPVGDSEALFSDSLHFNTPAADFSPRLGISWWVRPKTVLRASSGIFYDPPPSYNYFDVLNDDGTPRSVNVSWTPTSPGAPIFPAIPSSGGAAATQQNIVTLDPEFKNAYAINTSVELTQELASNDALTIGYENSSGRQLTYDHNINLINPIGTLADGRPIFSTVVSAATRMDPAFNNITMESPGAISDYDALLVTYQHRLARGMQVNASYTWSHAISDAPDVNGFEQSSSIEDPTDRTRDRGNSFIDRPDAFTVSAVFAPTFSTSGPMLRGVLNGNMLSILGNMSSGDPQNITSSIADLNGDTTVTSRPLFIGRDTARTPPIYQIDARYTRTLATLWERVKPTFFMEANNVFNHPNITSINTVAAVDATGAITSEPSFAPTSTVLEGRIVQFGLSVRW